MTNTPRVPLSTSEIPRRRTVASRYPGCWAWLILLAAMAGCGSGADNGTRADAPVVRLQVVADAVEAEAYRTLIDGFHRAHPDIRVEPVFVGRQQEHVTRLATSFAGRRPPDLFLINYRRYGQFLDRDLLDPLGPRLADRPDFAAANFYAPALEAFQFRGQQMCLPQNISTQVVYYNRALFQRFGVPEPAGDWNWKAFHDAARALTRDIDGDLLPDIFGLDFDPDLVHMAPFVWQAGGRIVDRRDNPRALALRIPDSVIGLMYPKRLRTEASVFPPLSQRRAVGPEQRFMNGDLGMLIQSRRLSTSFRAVTDLDWDVAPLPRNKEAATLLHADAYCLTRASKAPQAAATFVAYALGEAGQTLLSRTGRIVPVRRSVAESPAFLDPDQPPRRAQVFLDNIDIVRRLPITPRWYEVEMRAWPIIEEWMFEDMARLAAEANHGLNDGYRLVMLLDQAVGDIIHAPWPKDAADMTSTVDQP